MTTAREEEECDEIIPENARCTICLEMFKEPKILSCIHTFGLECLETCVNNCSVNELKCPLCREIFLIPHGGIKYLPNNVFIEELILKVNYCTGADKERLADDPILCETCADSEVDVPSTCYCVECEQDFCDRCAAIHKRHKLFKSHRILREDQILNSEEKSESMFDNCCLHPNERNKLYCHDCKVVMCKKCYVSHDDQHRCSEVGESAKLFIKQLKDDADAISNRVGWKYEDIYQLDVNFTNFQEKVFKTERDIIERHHQRVSLMELHTDNLLTELSEFNNRVTMKMSAAREEMEEQLKKGENLKTYCLEMRNKGTECDIISTANDLHARTKDFVKMQDEHYCSILSGVDITFIPTTIENMIGQLILQDEEISTTTSKVSDTPTCPTDW